MVKTEPPAVDAQLLAYLTEQERDALEETELWLGAEASRFKKMMGLTRKPIEFAYSKVPESLRDSIANAILKVLTSVRDGSASVGTADGVIEILERELGPIRSGNRILEADLARLDVIAKDLLKKSKAACTAEGAATGLAGLPGIVVDIPALYALLFRMISQIATCYGFEVGPEEERDHMLKIMDIGHQLEGEAKRRGMEELDQLQSMIRQNMPVVDVQRFAVQKGLQTMARHLGVALTQRKLAQSVALVGSVIGAGVNMQLAGEVGQVAFHAYRKRHLVERALFRKQNSEQDPQGRVPSDDKGAVVKCESCGAEAAEDDRFCQDCGGRLTPSYPIVVVKDPDQSKAAEEPADSKVEPAKEEVTAKMDGLTKIQVDKNTLNILLKEFASNDETQMSFEDGQIVVDKAGLKLTVKELPLKNTKLSLNGKFGVVNLELADFKLEESQLSLDIDVGLG